MCVCVSRGVTRGMSIDDESIYEIYLLMNSVNCWVGDHLRSRIWGEEREGREGRVRKERG